MHPPAPCGAGLFAGIGGFRSGLISIHPPRAGRDQRQRLFATVVYPISIHPPRAGRDFDHGLSSLLMSHFNPPAPCGAGHPGKAEYPVLHEFQSTRPVRGGTKRQRNAAVLHGISIHPPRAGRDISHGGPCGSPGISIHPPRAGRDLIAAAIRRTQTDFNPPAPCGAGRFSDELIEIIDQISIHPPRAGRDCRRGNRYRRTSISIHPPRAGRDSFAAGDMMTEEISIHPPRAGRDNKGISVNPSIIHFNPPAPCGAGQQSCTKFTPCILAQYTIQRAAKLPFAYQQAHFC